MDSNTELRRLREQKRAKRLSATLCFFIFFLYPLETLIGILGISIDCADSGLRLSNLVLADDIAQERNLPDQNDVQRRHQQARASIDKGEAALALKLLAEIPSALRSEETQKLTIDAVFAIKKLGKRAWRLEKNWPFDNKSVQRLLSEVLSKSPEYYLALADMYSVRVIKLAREQKLELASQYLTQIFQFRPDPNEANNSLRLKLAVMLSDEDTKYFSQIRVAELESIGALGRWARMRLLLSGFYGKKYPVILIGTLLFVTTLFFLLRFQPRLFAQKRQAPKKPKAGSSGYHYLASAPDEYSQLLHMLHLPDDATEDDIKHAYRTLVKEYHPDRVTHDHVEPERTDGLDRFREITEAYDRIMEIRKGWFGR